ncbi:MAG: hypothetical protein BWX68_00527 [Verrucomicrobia bacterium ADurb.Bin063]|jgi:hypothetical protein|nr:MAG: hypothetical protein BWX68_00527 [Verrucomicrobia bacterium ADurb.Bin063]
MGFRVGREMFEEPPAILTKERACYCFFGELAERVKHFDADGQREAALPVRNRGLRITSQASRRVKLTDD